MCSPISAVLTGAECIDERAGQGSGEEAERREKEHCGEREAVGFRRNLGSARARAAEKRHPVGLNEASGGERGRERRAVRPAAGTRKLQPP